jgi:predicted Zn-dependent protease
MVLAALTVALVGGAYLIGERLQARVRLRSAEEAVGRQAWSEAREHLEPYLGRRPNEPSARLLAARVARRLERHAETDEHLDACVRLQGEESRAVKVERALLRVHRRDLASVEAFLRQCVARDDPDSVEILDVLSAALILDYRVAEAQQCLDDLLQRCPDHFHALVRRGWTARSLNWYGQAVEHYQKALDLRPDADAVRLVLAEIQVSLGRTADAQGHFEELTRRQPDNPSARFGLARCLTANGKPAEAQRIFDHLIAERPNDWKALGERGLLALQLDRPAEGEAYLRRAAALAPPDLPLWTRFADCLNRLGKSDEAREYWTRADRLRADLKQAESLGKLIREERPRDPELRRELGCVLARVGKPQDALHWFRSALAEDPRHRPTHQSLAEFYEQAGDFDRAAVHRQALGELDRAR